MGRVWRAHYTAIKRNDALKVVPARSRLIASALPGSGEKHKSLRR